MTRSRTVLVTGANRGIGLEVVRQYAERGWTVLASCRRPGEAGALRELGRRYSSIVMQTLDVGQIDSIERFTSEVRGRPLDLLVNNAAMKGTEGGLAGAEMASWTEMMQVNAIGPILLARALLDELKAAPDAKVVVISSMKASITRNRMGGSYEYRSSKAALNAAVRSLAVDLRSSGITCVSISPGWVHVGDAFASRHLGFDDRLRVARVFREEFGASSKRISVDESVAMMIALIDGLTLEESGSFFDHEGTELTW